MTIYTGPQLRKLATDNGFAPAVAGIAAAIALAESGGNSDAVGDVALQTAKWGPSVGLWQIRSLKNPSAYSGTDAMRDASKLKDPAYNAQVAARIAKDKGNFNDWSVFTSGAYRSKTAQVGEASTADKVQDVLTTNPVSSATAGIDAVGNLANRLQDGSLWKRAGWYVSGYALLVAGLLVILLSNKDVQRGVKGVAGAAVTVVPGGGAVKGAAGAVKGATRSAASSTVKAVS